MPDMMRLICTTLVIALSALPARVEAQAAAPVAVREHLQAFELRTPDAAIAPERSGRSWARYPIIGAIIGGVGYQLYYLSYCTRDVDDGCMAGPAPLGFGAVAGAILGGIAELGHRFVTAVREKK